MPCFSKELSSRLHPYFNGSTVNFDTISPTSAVHKRHKHYTNLRSLAYVNDFILGQQTRLLSKDSSSLRNAVPTHTVFYNNYDRGKDKFLEEKEVLAKVSQKRAGTVIFIRNSLFDDYDIAHTVVV